MTNAPLRRIDAGDMKWPWRKEARKVRIGILRRVQEIPRMSGHGKVWGHTLDELAAWATIVPFETPTTGAEVDVWLNDGHGGWLPPLDKPIVAVVHEAGWHTEFLRSLLEPFFLTSIEHGTGESCRQAAAVITPAESSRRQLIEHYGLASEKIHVVPDGVDLATFRPGLPGGRALVERAGGNAGAPYVLAVVALHPRKNIPALRAAMDELALRDFPHELVIVPGPPADRVLDTQTRAALLGPLERSGRQVVSLENLREDELAALMASATALCQPSFVEGFGLPVLEAMACGVPVIASDRESLPEIVGAAGFVVPPTAEAFRDALIEIFQNPKRAAELGKAARIRAEGFTWTKTATGWLEVIRKVAPVAS